ncbi:MAG TPA: hypothetical protein VLB44_22130 [Kofleriaceae bacterium]|nr:hypothetical protein [Kofleriaceae bacterium]
MTTTGKGDVQVRVEWKDVPTDVRSSPGRTACGTPRAPSVSPTTTWGIPDVFVVIDVPGTADRPAPRIVLDNCALAPRVALAATQLTIASAMEAPARLALVRVSQLPFGGGALGGNGGAVNLPTAGHEVQAALEPKSVYVLQTENPDGKGFDLENTWIVTADTPFYGITEASGQIVLRDVPAGTHAVTAWLPPRASQDQRMARGTVTVIPGGLAEVTVDLAKP